MLNKKLLAAAIAASLSTNAFAAITMDDTVADGVTIATESYSAADYDGDGNLVVTNAATELNIVKTVGFTVGTGTSRFVRIDITNGVFNAGPTLATDSASGTFSASISQGGTAGDSFVIFEISDSGQDILTGDTLTIAAASYAANPGENVTFRYRLYETGAGAVNELDSAELVDAQELAISFGASLTGAFTTESTVTALVGQGFAKYDDGTASGSATGTFAVVDHNLLLGDGTYRNAAGAAWTADDLVTAAQDVMFAGDFSFGTWSLDPDGNCTDTANATALTLNEAENEGTVSVADLTAGNYALCNVLAADSVALKGSYTATLVTDEMTDGAGTLVYNTTSIEVPYLTTFDAYNQRIYLINNGSSDALYTTTFTSEDVATATAGAQATGTVPAGEMVAIKATDLVTLTGRSRTSAVIEIEATDGDISAASQSVNLSTGTTDTVVLN